MDTIRNGLSSVLDSGNTLRFFHQSFVDFLLDRNFPKELQITDPPDNQYLTNTCLDAMSIKLRFNVCDLETSLLFNVDVPDIAKKIKNGIPSHLSYSCHFWANHLTSVPFDKGLMKKVKEVA